MTPGQQRGSEMKRQLSHLEKLERPWDPAGWGKQGKGEENEAWRSFGVCLIRSSGSSFQHVFTE